jgi:hypothetical protein
LHIINIPYTFLYASFLSTTLAFSATVGVILLLSMENPDDLHINDAGSSPQNEWDDFWAVTHKNTKASWDVAEDDDSDELDFEPVERDED